MSAHAPKPKEHLPAFKTWDECRAYCEEKGDHSAERLQLERERLDFDRERKAKTDEELLNWAMQPENRQRICGGGLSEDEKVRRIREIFGLRTDAPPTNQGESSPIKPDRSP